MPRFFPALSKNKFLWSKLPVRYRGALILSIPAICTIAILVMWIWSREDAIAVHRQIDRSEATIIETNNILASIIGAEAAIRGYTISQESSFLDAYERAKIDLPISLGKLQDLNQDNSQSPKLAKIDRLVRQEMELLEETLKRSETVPNSLLVNNFLSRSQTTLNTIVDNTETLRASEWLALDVLREKLFDIRKTTNILLCSLTLISLLSFLAALYLFSSLDRELENRRIQLQTRAAELTKLNNILAKINTTLTERNQELSDFSHIVSHDLKAPLRAISNLSVWIEEDLEDKLTPKNQKQMNLLRERVGRMENTIDGLLQYARVGRQNNPTEMVDVGQLLTETIDSLEPPPEFDIVIAKDMPTLKTQRYPLAQVFANLISNAIAHHHRFDGKVSISVREIEKFYEFAVTDDGPGIAAEAQTRIFDIFQTSSKYDNKRHTGIGLATVKKIVENQQGKITVESELGQGTTFRFLWAK